MIGCSVLIRFIAGQDHESVTSGTRCYIFWWNRVSGTSRRGPRSLCENLQEPPKEAQLLIETGNLRNEVAVGMRLKKLGKGQMSVPSQG